jgi:hypothetical protein
MEIKYHPGLDATIIGASNIAGALEFTHNQKKALQKLEKCDWGDLFAVVERNKEGTTWVVIRSKIVLFELRSVTLANSHINWEQELEDIKEYLDLEYGRLEEKMNNISKQLSKLDNL